MTSMLAIQQRLLSLGYNPGPVDGEDGPKTRDAVKHSSGLVGLLLTALQGRRPLLCCSPMQRRRGRYPSLPISQRPSGRSSR
jgi:hypothetical protein